MLKLKSIPFAILLGIAAISLAGAASAVPIITGLTPGDFSAPTIEDFSGGSATTTFFDFGNGMVYQSGVSNLVNRVGSYGMGSEPNILGGRDGAADGYFGTGPTPATFEFAFAGGISKFGFYGAESAVGSLSAGRNAELDIEFYDISDTLIEALAVSTTGAHAWNQFHGFAFGGGIGRVVFADVGHMVLDDVHFESLEIDGDVPEPTTLAIFGIGLAGLGVMRRRRKVATQ